MGKYLTSLWRQESLRGDGLLRALFQTPDDNASAPTFPSKPPLRFVLFSRQQLSSSPTPTLRQSSRIRTLVTLPENIMWLDWWWEAGATLVSVICTVLIIVILLLINDKPLATWPFSIQPGSLIAIFSTMAKSALLVPTASCISQLKWTYFRTPTPLSKFQRFDDASRGPLGAMILFKTTYMDPMASLGVWITVVALAFEPFTQQVLQFPSRYTILGNITGSVTTSYAWSDKDLDVHTGAHLQASFDSGVINQLIDRPSLKPDLYCPTSECQFPSFISLAACASCESEDIPFGDSHDCDFQALAKSEDSAGQIAKLFSTYSELEKYRKENADGSALENLSANCTVAKTGYPGIKYIISEEEDAERGPQLMPEGFYPSESSFGYDPSQRTEQQIFNTTFYNSCHSFGSVDLDNSEEFATINKFFCLKTQSLPHRIEDLERSGVKAQVTWCHLQLCAQSYQNVTIRNGVMDSHINDSTPLRMNGSSSGDNVGMSGDNTSTKFYIGDNSCKGLSDMIRNLTDSVPLVDSFIIPFMQSSNSAVPFFQSMAEVTTALIRSSRTNPAVKNCTGDAFGQETYVRVRWQWFLMPVSIVLLSALFLILTILQSCHQKHNLYRSSVLAELFHGLDGWDADELKLEAGSGKGMETDSKLLEKANSMKVILKENDEGILKFMKTD